MRALTMAFVCTTALAVGACGRGAEDTTRDQPAADTGVQGEPEAADRDVGDRMGDALTGERELPQFLEEAAISNMAEIRLGQLAQKRAQNPEVRKFGQLMVTEHTRALNDLKKVASAAGVQLPAELDEEHRQLQERLSGLKGEEFDREYMSAMVDAHQDTVDLLEDRAEQDRTVGTTGERADRAGEASAAGEQQAVSWAAKTLPSVQQHLQQARQLQQRVDDRDRTEGQREGQSRPGQQERE